MSKSIEPKANELDWSIRISKVEHQAGNYPVFEWLYGSGKAVAFVIQAWPQGYLRFKESRESDGEAFKTGNVEELLIWMEKVKNWTKEPPQIRQVWETILETRSEFSKSGSKDMKKFFDALWEKLRAFYPSA